MRFLISGVAWYLIFGFIVATIILTKEIREDIKANKPIKVKFSIIAKVLFFIVTYPIEIYRNYL